VLPPCCCSFRLRELATIVFDFRYVFTLREFYLCCFIFVVVVVGVFFSPLKAWPYFSFFAALASSYANMQYTSALFFFLLLFLVVYKA